MATSSISPPPVLASSDRDEDTPEKPDKDDDLFVQPNDSEGEVHSDNDTDA